MAAGPGEGDFFRRYGRNGNAKLRRRYRRWRTFCWCPGRRAVAKTREQIRGDRNELAAAGNGINEAGEKDQEQHRPIEGR